MLTIEDRLDNILKELQLIKIELTEKKEEVIVITPSAPPIVIPEIINVSSEAIPDSNGNLSKNFTVKEIACRCCGVCKVDTRLINALQKLRDLVGSPIKINSSCRCEKHNKEIGGEERSKHLFGVGYQPFTLAADIQIPGRTIKKSLAVIERVPDFLNGGIGIYPDKSFIHVDVRKGKSRWAQKNNKYVDFDQLMKSLSA